jgi:hypothetical protein
MQMPMLMFRLVLDGNLCRPEAPFLDFAADKPAAWKAERVNARLDCRQVRADVYERAEQHVAADSTGTIEVSDSHKLLARLQNSF